MEGQIVKKDGTPCFDLRGNGTVFVNGTRTEPIPKPSAITGIAIVNNGGFMGTRKELETPVFNSRIVKRDPNRELVCTVPIGPILVPRAGEGHRLVLKNHLIAQELNIRCENAF